MRLDHREGQLEVTVVVTFRLTKIFLLFSKHRAWPVHNKEPVLRVSSCEVTLMPIIHSE